MYILRWVLLLPVTVCTWYLMFPLGLYTYFFIERHFCPPQDMVSGFCYNPFIQDVLAVVMHLAVALSAVVVELVAIAMAPSHKELTLWATLALGIVAAAMFGMAAHAWSLFLAAMLGGALSAMAISLFFWVHRARSQTQEARR